MTDERESVEAQAATRATVAALMTRASDYAESRAAGLRLRLSGIHPDNLAGREHYIALELSRAWMQGHMEGLEKARDTLKELTP